MSALETERQRKWQRIRRVAFYVWAAVLSLSMGLTFVGVTGLTVVLWLTEQNTDTNPVTDLGFFALGGVIIATGFVVQLRAPERKIAGLQQAVAGLLALAVAGLVGRRIEPFTGALLLLVASAVLVALHPRRHDFFRSRGPLSRRLAALALLASVPATVYAASMLVEARQAGPSCFLGRCAAGDRFAELAALALAIVATAVLAAAKQTGWRIPAWSAGVAAVTLGAASLVLPEVAGALGSVGGVFATAWGILFIVVAEMEVSARQESVRRSTA